MRCAHDPDECTCEFWLDPPEPDPRGADDAADRDWDDRERWRA